MPVDTANYGTQFIFKYVLVDALEGLGTPKSPIIVVSQRQRYLNKYTFHKFFIRKYQKAPIVQHYTCHTIKTDKNNNTFISE